MAKTDFQSVDEYLATLPDATQEVLQRVRLTLRKAMPRTEEGISYQIPVFRLEGSPVVFFAGWKQHYSLYPASVAMVEAFQSELAAYKVSKGTIRFPLSEPIPVKLIARLAKFRFKETAERLALRSSRKKKT